MPANPDAIFKITCDECGATAKGTSKDLSEKKWSRTKILYPIKPRYIMACPEHRGGYLKKVNEEIGKGYGFRTQVGGITLKGIRLGGKMTKATLVEEERSGIEIAVAESMTNPMLKSLGGI